MRSDGYRSRLRRSHKRKFWKKTIPLMALTVIILAGIVLTGFIASGYNPFLTRQLQSQFGDVFFSDFEITKPIGDDTELEDIIGKYIPVFEFLETQAGRKLDSLVDSALDEYQEQKRDGTYSRLVLANKYIQAGRMLEKQVDKTFYELLGELEKELTRNGYSTDLIREVEKTYKKEKEERKQILFKRLHRERERLSG